ncbi:MAG: SDR family oxidoreductase, partial [Candidatus Rokuibacteriota bacterium]
TERGHEGATYELAGPEVLNQDDVARLLGEALGRQVTPEVVPAEDWARDARAAGLGDYQIDTLQAMFRYYEWGGFWGNPRVLGWLLGRPPTTFAQFTLRVSRGQRR